MRQGISSSEIVVENEGAMIIEGENNIQDDDEDDDEYGQEDQEMNIEGGEHNIDEEDE
jgi:hypothetical protein